MMPPDSPLRIFSTRRPISRIPVSLPPETSSSSTISSRVRPFSRASRSMISRWSLGERYEEPERPLTRLTRTYPSNVLVAAIRSSVGAGRPISALYPHSSKIRTNSQRANGAGKSTTIGMLTTTVEPTSGSGRLAGYDVAKQPLAARSVSSVVFQEPVVDRSLTGRRNLELHARRWGVRSARIDEPAAGLGIADLLGRPVATYSGGERRRLEIARALVSKPRVLFLDEPTVGLDPRIRHELLDVLAGLRDRNETTILVT